MSESTVTQPTPAAAPGGYERGIHVMPVGVLLAVFVALIFFTVLTVAVRAVDLGQWNLWIAMGIASLKAALVALYFMHLRYDHPFNGLLFAIAVVFLALFVSLTLVDTEQYQPDVENRPHTTPY